jgi:hypothetical protein
MVGKTQHVFVNLARGSAELDGHGGGWMLHAPHHLVQGTVEGVRIQSAYEAIPGGVTGNPSATAEYVAVRDFRATAPRSREKVQSS